MDRIVKVYPITDPDYTHAALALVDGKPLPMGAGRGKALNEAAAVSIAASNAGFPKDGYSVEPTTEAELFRGPR